MGTSEPPRAVIEVHDEHGTLLRREEIYGDASGGWGYSRMLGDDPGALGRPGAKVSLILTLPQDGGILIIREERPAAGDMPADFNDVRPDSALASHDSPVLNRLFENVSRD